jgi:penicillin-binding protein 1A
VPSQDVRHQKAFLAAEDKRFYRHKGIDERGLIRTFIGNLAQSGRPQGGSTITQQIVKNLLVGEDLTYDRKIREKIVASRGLGVSRSARSSMRDVGASRCRS